MPTVADLERLEALVSNLKDISNKQRGELIEAEAWNRLVAAVIDIGQAALAGEVNEEVAAHKHNDQVSLEWLDPKLRSIILEGSAGDPSTVAQADKFARQLAKFGQTLAEFSDRLNQIQKDISGVATRDVERETSVGDALRKLDGVFDARNDVANLRGSLRLIEGQVRTAADLSGRLVDDNGEEIDFNGLSRRVIDLEGLRENLVLPTGSTFDADGYARDLAQLRAELVTEAELEEALGNVGGGISDDLRNELRDDARVAALEGNADAFDSFGRDLRGEQDGRFRALEDSLDGRIDAATGDLQSQILTNAREEQSSILDERFGAFGASRDAEMDRRLGALTDDVTRRIDGLNETVRGDITDAVTADLDGRLAEFDRRFAGIDATTNALDERLGGNTRSLNTNAARIETVSRDLQLANSRLNAQLTERIATIEFSLDERIKGATDANRVAMRAERETELAVMRDQMNVELTRTLRDVAKTEVAMASTQLRGEMTDIASAEIDSGLAMIRDEVRETGAVTDAQLAGMVSAEVRRATADLDDRIRVGVESHELTVNRNVNTDPVIMDRGGLVLNR